LAALLLVLLDQCNGKNDACFGVCGSLNNFLIRRSACILSPIMVILHVKREGQSLFLHEATLNETVSEVLPRVVQLHNARIKLRQLADQLVALSQHGVSLPPEMQGLLAEQLAELKLSDEEGKRCLPEQAVLNPDPLQRRGGRAPPAEKAAVLERAAAELCKIVSKERVTAGQALRMDDVREALEMTRGAVALIYPMGLPHYDPVRAELDHEELLDGPGGASTAALDPSEATLWFASKELCGKDPLSKSLGRNEKSKVVVKLSTPSLGRPAAESSLDEDARKRLMADNYRRMEELKRLERDADDSYLNSAWADGQELKRRFQGLSNISWKP